MIRTTIVGYSDTNLKLKESYIYRLDNHLSAYYPGISWNVHDEAIKGASTRELLNCLHERVLCHNPNIVFISLSSNDSCSDSNKLIGLDGFESNVIEIISEIRVHNNRTGLNGCIPIPVLITPAPVNEKITGALRTNNRLRQYVYIIKKVAADKNVPIINLFDAVYTKPDFITYLNEDGFSLNLKGHDLLYDLVFSELTKLINYQGILKDRDVLNEEEFKR